MSFIPEEDLKSRATLNLAPMIDFLFLMLMFFATVAVTRATTKDTDIQLVEIKPDNHSSHAGSQEDTNTYLNISILADGTYKWVTELRDYPMETSEEIEQELQVQYEKGLLPEDKSKTQILLKIDKSAPWEPILKVLFAVREAGYDARPVYEPEEG